MDNEGQERTIRAAFGVLSDKQYNVYSMIIDGKFPNDGEDMVSKGLVTDGKQLKVGQAVIVFPQPCRKDDPNYEKHSRDPRMVAAGLKGGKAPIVSYGKIEGVLEYIGFGEKEIVMGVGKKEVTLPYDKLVEALQTLPEANPCVG